MSLWMLCAGVGIFATLLTTAYVVWLFVAELSMIDDEGEW